eukprot:TRINITY_DN8900_c0_g1_i1.p1 TRINITY_DN8900_c0_g1~~TRINITY_DN8900_c0_g1_i1.p1  ORF type:complete len:234 (+),score=28.93 TRINITY_DN8900_c0_g1_i1:105-806(+)
MSRCDFLDLPQELFEEILKRLDSPSSLRLCCKRLLDAIPPTSVTILDLVSKRLPPVSVLQTVTRVSFDFPYQLYDRDFKTSAGAGTRQDNSAKVILRNLPRLFPSLTSLNSIRCPPPEVLSQLTLLRALDFERTFEHFEAREEFFDTKSEQFQAEVDVLLTLTQLERLRVNATADTCCFSQLFSSPHCNITDLRCSISSYGELGLLIPQLQVLHIEQCPLTLTAMCYFPCCIR